MSFKTAFVSVMISKIWMIISTSTYLITWKSSFLKIIFPNDAYKVQTDTFITPEEQCRQCTRVILHIPLLSFIRVLQQIKDEKYINASYNPSHLKQTDNI